MYSKKIIDLIKESIEEINLFQDDNKKLELNEDTALVGRNSILDSMGFVNFIVDLEERINTAFNSQIILMDEKALSAKNSPFRNISTLAEYINTLLCGNANG